MGRRGAWCRPGGKNGGKDPATSKRRKILKRGFNGRGKLGNPVGHKVSADGGRSRTRVRQKKEAQCEIFQIRSKKANGIARRWNKEQALTHNFATAK